MSTPTLSPREVLAQLDARHEELIRRLDELNAQIETALAEFAATRSATPAPAEIRKAA
jgi:hypothetical protein